MNKKTIRVVAAVIKSFDINKNKTLIFSTQKGKGEFENGWEFPGGKIEQNETPKEALKREIKEELGVNILSAKYICSFPNVYPYSGINVKTTDLGYLVEIENIEKIHPEDDVAGILWKKPNEVDIEQIPSISIKNFILKCRELFKE